jgi:hypothetical protein
VGKETPALGSIEEEAETLAQECGQALPGEEDLFDGAVPATRVTAVAAAESPLLDLEEAKARIGPKALAVLEEKFKGRLSGVRRLDSRDMLF